MTFTEIRRDYLESFNFYGSVTEPATAHIFQDGRGYEYRVTIGQTRAVIGQKMARNFEPGRGVEVWPLESWQAMDTAARRCIAAALEAPAAVKLDREATRRAGYARGPWWQREYTIFTQDSATPGA